MQKYLLTDQQEDALAGDVVCSFCGGTRHSREYMFQAANGLAICDSCILLCLGIIQADAPSNNDPTQKN